MAGTPISPTGRVDERDTVFARMARRPGTPTYEAYYAGRPDLKAIDDRLRAMPPLLDPRGRHYDAAIAEETARLFEAIDAIEVDPALVREAAARLRSTADATTAVKAMFRGLGAVAVGCTPVEEAFVYTHKGRFDEGYGDTVDLPHRHAILFLVEMDHAAMRRAPLADTLLESARQYRRAAEIAITAAAVLRAAGHDAKPHYDAHYDVMLVPLAVKAGLGELGRNNLLVADRFGSRVRIGAVTTGLDLRPDAPVSLGVDRFCAHCRKCAENCPAHALSTGDKETVRGARKWPTNVERCHGWWRQVGTDCGICMVTCPFSHPDNAFHRFVRGLLERAPRLGRLFKRGDDLFYGRRWRPSSRRP